MTTTAATTIIGLRRAGHFGLDDLVRLLETKEGRETLYEIKMLKGAK